MFGAWEQILTGVGPVRAVTQTQTHSKYLEILLGFALITALSRFLAVDQGVIPRSGEEERSLACTSSEKILMMLEIASFA